MINNYVKEMTKAFVIGQRVKVVQSDDLFAFVQQICHNVDGIQYQISYWHENIRRCEWVFPSEIEAVK